MALLLLAVASVLWAAGPPAGTDIANQAHATYVNPATGATIRLDSNAVVLTIQPVEALTLTQDQTVEAAIGTVVNLPHTLTNTGNTPSSYTLDLANLSGDDFDLGGLRVVLDVNGNGRAEAGEPSVTAATPLRLTPGESLTLVIVGGFTSGAANGKSARVTLGATTRLQHITASNTDTVIGRGTITYAAVKSVSPAQPVAGGTLTYTVTARNNGQVPAGARSVQVDGAPRDLVMLTDRIPANTVLQGLTGSVAAGTQLYHLNGTPADSYVSTAPASLGAVDVVGYGVAASPPGSSFTFSFTVRLSPLAGGEIANTASLAYRDPVLGSTAELATNTVRQTLACPPPTIAYYTTNGFTQRTSVTHLGDPLFVQAEVGSGNTDASRVETIQITLRSLLTGDSEVFVATETGPNTGVFRITPPVPTQGSDGNGAPGNGTIETRMNDEVVAHVDGCNGQSAEATIVLDPTNVVYDSTTSELIAGAKVTLMAVTGARAETPAQVFGVDGVTPSPNPVTTQADGRFAFPFVRPGSYRIAVEPPAGYRYPTTKAPGQLPIDRVNDVTGSFDKVFEVTGERATVRFDIPLDAPPLTGLFVEKVAERTSAEIGDFLRYTVNIRNTNRVDVSGLVIIDTLPQGFTYVKGTTVIDKGTIAEPTVASDRSLRFALPTLAARSQIILTYRVRIGSSAKPGRTVNAVSVTATSVYGPLTSNTATAAVQLYAGVFSDRGILFGTVFVDVNQNGIQNRGEPGIPGVHVLLDDGTYAITDSEGKYSLYGLKPGTHVAKIDPTTLPAGCRLERISNRSGDDPGSVFVDLKDGELHRADFADSAASAQILAAVAKRRGKGEPGSLEGAGNLDSPLAVDGMPSEPSDVRGRPATGVVGGGDATGGLVQPTPGTAPTSGQSAAGALPPAPVRPSPAAALEQLLTGLDNSLDFVGLRDGDTLPWDQLTVRVKGVAGAELAVEVNGQPVGADRLGNRALLADRQIEVREYYGLALRAGENQLTVIQRDPFGNERGRRSIKVIAPGKLGRVRLTLPPGNQQANAYLSVPIRVEVLDDRGARVTARTPVTLEATMGGWATADLDAMEPGLQIIVDGGAAEVSMQAPAEAGVCDVRATCGRLTDQGRIRFLPFLRDLVGAGLIEARVGLTGRAGGAGLSRPFEPFESDLRALAGSSGDLNGGVRVSGYFKGRIFGDSLLTIGYDSEKTKNERLFRDIQPEEYYPVYGDSSIRGYDAQSTSRLFARVEHGLSYGQFGDFSTEGANESRSLGAYYRSLTGLMGHYETPWAKANVFGSYDNARQIVQEFAANGTSGPFMLGFQPFRENSERIEILVRDRNQPSLVLSLTAQARFTDYTIEAETGRLIFRQPIASRDSNLNPVFIRVTYEVEDGGKRFFVFGMDGTLSVTRRLRLGGSLVFDQNPVDPLQLRSADLTWQLAPRTTLIGEVAQSWSRGQGTGQAGRVEVNHQGDRLQAKLYAVSTGASFYNPSALTNRGRTELGIKGHYLIDRQTRLSAEALHTKDLTTHESLTGMQMSVERQLGSDVAVELGLRHANGSLAATASGVTGEQHTDFTTVRAKVSGNVPGLRDLRLFGEYETDVTDLSKRVLAVGGEYQVSNRMRLYARHELLSSIAGRYLLDETHQQNTTLVGVEADYMRDGHIFSEYRSQDAFNGRETQAAIGLRNRWDLARGLSVDTTFERIQGFEGRADMDSLAATGAVVWRPRPGWVATGRLEGRFGNQSDSTLGSLGLAGKLSRDWTLLGRYLYTSDSRGGTLGAGTRVQQRLAVGAAWRDTLQGRISALGRYEFRSERDTTTLSPTDRTVHILSGNMNLRVARPTLFTARYAGKLAEDCGGGVVSSQMAHLLSARLTQDIGRRADCGLTTSYRFGAGETGWAVGAELGYQVGGGLWLSGGWNWAGFHETDLTGLGYTDNGPYLRLRLKFDEGMFE